MNISISESVKADEYFSRVFLSEKSVPNRESIYVLRSCIANNTKQDKKFIPEKLICDQIN
jgi:3-methyladenine DNA glycosylase AlkC